MNKWPSMSKWSTIHAIFRSISIGFIAASASFAPVKNSYAADVTLIVGGLGGDARYTTQFNGFISAIAEQAKKVAQSESDVLMLNGNAASKDIINSLFGALAAREDINLFSAYFIGHGTFDGSQYKFNVPGPDITGAEITELLNSIRANKQLVVVSSSSSGALLDVIDPGNNTTGQRVLLTATKNGREKTAVRFTQYLVDALVTDAADTDKNESVNAREVFDYATAKVNSFYETEKLLAPEHAMLKGERAETFEATRYGALLAAQDTLPPELLSRRDELATEISNLKSRKADLDEDDYFDKLQDLMLELADLQKQIDSPQGSE